MKLTKQEMFDRAYRGLASQGWKRSLRSNGECAYVADDRRCAWGWVDMSLTESDAGDVGDLRLEGLGIAADLSDDDLRFAMDLQSEHDGAWSDLRGDMHRFAHRHSLTLPELP